MCGIMQQSNNKWSLQSNVIVMDFVICLTESRCHKEQRDPNTTLGKED